MNTTDKIDELYGKGTGGEWYFSREDVDGDGINRLIDAPENTFACIVSALDIGQDKYEERDANAKLIVALHNSWPLIREVLLASEEVIHAPDNTTTAFRKLKLYEALQKLEGNEP